MSSFSQNLIGRSGNCPYVRIGKNINVSSTYIKSSRFFAQRILNNAMRHLIAFFFSFSSHVTRKSSQEKSSYRLWNHDCEFWMILWLVIYQKKAHNLQSSKKCIWLQFIDRGQIYGHFPLEESKWSIFTYIVTET